MPVLSMYLRNEKWMYPEEWHVPGLPHNIQIGNMENPLPYFLAIYFLEKRPVGTYVTDEYPSLINPGKEFFKTFQRIFPKNSHYKAKFEKFQTGRWDEKLIKDIPGVGKANGERIKMNLGVFGSVAQLHDMWVYWNMRGTPIYFFYLLRWAAAAYYRKGNWLIELACDAFHQKHMFPAQSWFPSYGPCHHTGMLGAPPVIVASPCYRGV